MKWRGIIIPVVLVFAAAQPAFAVWIGKGEVIGEVIQSRSGNDKAVFRLTISSQRIEDGPELGSPNTFSFDGLGCNELTKGDVVKLRVNSSDDYGIRVEQVEFIENKPGAIEESYGICRFSPLTAALTVSVIFLLGRRRRDG